MRVLFIGTHGQNNLGDELLLQVFISKLSANVSEWYINSYQPEQTRKQLKYKNITTFHTRRSPLQLIKFIYKSDVIIFGGGSIIKELYPEYGGERYMTLRLLQVVTYTADKLLKKPILMCNVGIGPLGTVKGESMAQQILLRTHSVSVRDIESLRLAKGLCQGVTVKQVPDAVFAADKEFLGVNKRNAEVSKTIIGVNICRNIQNNQNWQYFISCLVSNLTLLHQKNRNLRFIGIPMQQRTVTNDDANELELLRKRLKQLSPTLKFDIKRPRSVKAMASAIQDCDFVIGERLHFIITASILNKPYVALNYDPKVLGLVQQMNMEEYCVNINNDFSPYEIYEKVDKLMTNKKIVSQNMKKKVKQLHILAERSLEEIKDQLR